jgi:hypothetical protein
MEGAWTADFADELFESLAAFSDMEDPDFRRLILKHARGYLGSPAALSVKASSVMRDHLLEIVHACAAYREPPRAVSAIVDTIAELRPDAAALARLRACADYITGESVSVLGTVRLHAVLELLGEVSLVDTGISIHDLLRRVKADNEGVPLLGFEASLPQIVWKLDSARKTVPVDVPLVVRFLAGLAGELEGKAPQLDVMVRDIVAALGLPAAAAEPGASGEARDPASAGKRVLRVRLNDESTPERRVYTIEGGVYAAAGEQEERIAWCPSDGSLTPAETIETAGSQFLARARNLTDAVGLIADPAVEFMLPWPLLGQPVERWRLNGGRKWIGHQFPVVVRPLDRPLSSFTPWKTRWDTLRGPHAARPVRDHIGWLHYGDTAIPRHAVENHRVLSSNGQYGIITQWLASAENRLTACMGLTFAYQYEDPAGLDSVKDVLEEGIPVLLWRRDNGDANDLEILLQDVSIKDLPARVLLWRRQTAACLPDTDDARYHVVLLWDDPYNVGPPPATMLTTPR